jgi:hypothetical protein
VWTADVQMSIFLPTTASTTHAGLQIAGADFVVEGDKYGDALLAAECFCTSTPQAYVLFFLLDFTHELTMIGSVLVPSFGKWFGIKAIYLNTHTVQSPPSLPYFVRGSLHNDVRDSSSISGWSRSRRNLMQGGRRRTLEQRTQRCG